MAKNRTTNAITSGNAIVIEGIFGRLISVFLTDFSLDLSIEDPHTRHREAFVLILEPQTGQVDDWSVFLFDVILIPICYL
jgi:hypothetical protein